METMGKTDEAKNHPRPREVETAYMMTVICTQSFVGAGTENDPCRIVTQYWSQEGELLATADPAKT